MLVSLKLKPKFKHDILDVVTSFCQAVALDSLKPILRKKNLCSCSNSESYAIKTRPCFGQNPSCVRNSHAI